QMYLARNEMELDSLQRAAPVLQGLGLPVQIVVGHDLKELCPHLSPIVIGALYCPMDGQANPILATRFLGKLAERRGVRILTGTAVTGLEHQSGRITGVLTARGRIATGAVVCAVGPWANDIAGMVGVTLPVRPERTCAAVTTPTWPVLRQTLSGHTVFIRPTRAGNLLFTGNKDKPAPGFSKESDLAPLRWSVRRLAELLPPLAQTSILRTWAGTQAVSPDHMLILDQMPGVENMTVVTGCSGHGFCLGPAAGKVLAELSLGHAPSVPIDGLRLARFGPSAPPVVGASWEG
ncbi:MAG TPA: FAD-binding oxidoreductase, partial [bacterium]|nr:FAD-binding oxidoreductase [bacterium]